MTCDRVVSGQGRIEGACPKTVGHLIGCDSQQGHLQRYAVAHQRPRFASLGQATNAGGHSAFPPSTQHGTICGDLVIDSCNSNVTRQFGWHDAGAKAERWLMLCIALIFCML